MLRLYGTIGLIVGCLLPCACSKSTPTTTGSAAENKSALSKEDSVKEDIKRLEARWTAVLDEEESRSSNGRGDGMLIEGQEIQFLWGGNNKGARAKFTLDPAKEPKEIHLVYIQGSEINQKRPGIYRFQGDQLQICWAPLQAGQPPRKFSGQLEPGSGRLMTYLPPDKAASFQPPTRPDPKPNVQNPPASGDTYASLGREVIATGQETIRVLKTVKDEKTAKSALPRLQTLKAQLEAQGQRLAKLGAPTSKQDQQLMQQFTNDYAPIEKMFEAEGARLKKVKGAEAIIKLFDDKK